MTCGITQQHTANPIYSSDVTLVNAAVPPCIVLPDQPTLNQFIEAISIYVCSLVPITTWGTDNITLDADLTCIKIDEGDTLTNALVDIDTHICSLITSISGFVSESDYNANTILAANVDDTPLPLTINQQTFVGRLTGGNIASLTAAQSRDIQQDVQVDAFSVHPYAPTKFFASGDETTGNKALIVAKESATFSTNPYIGWSHNLLGKGYEAQEAVGKAATMQSISARANANDAAVIAWSEKTDANLKDQTVYLADDVGGALRYWYLRKDGADSRNLKLGYFNGTSESEKLEVDVATGKFNFNATTAITGVLDDDTFAADSNVHVATQQSTKAYITSVAATVAEVNAIETGAGLSVTGTYVPDAGSNYLTAATSLFNADDILDTQVKLINDRSDVTVEQTKKNALCALEVVGFADIQTAGTTTISATAFPTGSVITAVRIHVTSSFLDNGTAGDAGDRTIGVYITGVGDIKAAVACVPNYAAGVISNAGLAFDYTFATPLVTTAGDKIRIVVADVATATAFTAGSMRIYVEYF